MQNTPLHTGWLEEEDALLFSEVHRAREEGLPLKAVFDAVARKTDRRPNSIRNYYYAKIKADESLAPAPACAAFVPFTEAEIDALLREVLTAQAQGLSVRACTLAMGKGDTKAMLRYQNKYRSVVKSDPARVERIRAELETAGVPAFDPYATTRVSRAGRPRKRAGSLIDVVSGVVSDLDQVEGLDVTAFFEALGALALSANRGAAALRAMDAQGALRKEELLSRVKAQEAELAAQRERFNALLSLYRQLLSVNRAFLGMTGVTKMSSLSNYIRDLSHNVEACEKLLPELV